MAVSRRYANAGRKDLRSSRVIPLYLNSPMGALAQESLVAPKMSIMSGEPRSHTRVVNDLSVKSSPEYPLVDMVEPEKELFRSNKNPLSLSSLCHQVCLTDCTSVRVVSCCEKYQHVLLSGWTKPLNVEYESPRIETRFSASTVKIAVAAIIAVSSRGNLNFMFKRDDVVKRVFEFNTNTNI